MGKKENHNLNNFIDENIEEESLEDFPVDEADQQKRFLDMMLQLQKQGDLNLEEEEKLFGKDGYFATGSFPEEQAVEEKEISHKGKWMRTLGKCAGFVLVVTACVFGLTMTSEANRTYVMDTVNYALGKDARVKIRNAETALNKEPTEAEAGAKIEETLGVEVPEITYRPVGLIFSEYKFLDEMNMAFLRYNYGKYKFAIYISTGEEVALDSGVFQGTPQATIPIARSATEADIYMAENEEGLPTMGAILKREDGYYQLCGNMEEEEFVKIVENLLF